jgi:hypothetical protein
MKLDDYMGFEIHVSEKTGRFSAVQIRQTDGGYTVRVEVLTDRASLDGLRTEIKKMLAIKKIKVILVRHDRYAYLGEITSVKENKGHYRPHMFRVSYKDGDGLGTWEEVEPGSANLFPATPENLEHLKAVGQLEFQIGQINNAIRARLDQMKGVIKLEDVQPKEAVK